MDKTVTITQNKPTPSFIEDIKELVAQGRRQAYAAVNQAMVSTYWQIGKRIVEEEQQGQTRAEYGKQLQKYYLRRSPKNSGRAFRCRIYTVSDNSFSHFQKYSLHRGEF